MNRDLCVKMEEGILNIRVGAIIMKEDQFLMVENDRFDHMYSVGGRIKFGEMAEDGNQERLVWIRADHPKKYYSEFFKTELAHPSKEVKHYVTKNI